MFRLFKATFVVLGTIVGCMMLMVISFLFLCMNTFTIPIWIIMWLLCKLIHVQTPRIAFYSLMVYPSWKNGKRASFLDDVNRYCKWSERRALRKAARYRPIRAWEERFF